MSFDIFMGIFAVGGPLVVILIILVVLCYCVSRKRGHPGVVLFHPRPSPAALELSELRPPQPPGTQNAPTEGFTNFAVDSSTWPKPGDSEVIKPPDYSPTDPHSLSPPPYTPSTPTGNPV